MSGSNNGQGTSGGYVVGIDRKAEAEDLRRILSLPVGERERALADRIRARRERAAAYAAREIDQLLDE